MRGRRRGWRGCQVGSLVWSLACGGSEPRATEASQPTPSPSDADPAANEATAEARASDRHLEPTDVPPAATRGPFIRVLGTAQDGGLPHAGCACERCLAARRDPRRRRRVASLALVSSARDGAVLIDATPDIHDQLAMVAELAHRRADGMSRAPVSGILLTHAHIGHYLGLALLGFEAVNTHRTPVWASASMASFLRDNGPWGQLVALENIALTTVEPGEEIVLAPDLRVVPLAVPHRDEYSDTLGYSIAGPQRRALYIPDSSPWTTWRTPLVDALEGIDIALLDATFYSGDELPGRDLSQIGHPLVVDSLELLQPLVDAGLRVYFIHLNHSNPAVDPGSEERARLEARGFLVAEEGLELAL